MSGFVVSKIVIVDSLKDWEFQTGEQLEGVIRYEFDEHDLPIGVERYSLTSAVEFAPLIKRLAVAADEEPPLLHIEMHGDPYGGLYFSDDSNLSWAEVSDILLPLNMATGFNLVCVFAACYGAYFTDVLYVTHASPCFALIAPADELDPGEVHRAFRTLYHNFAVTKDMGIAAERLKEQVLVQGGWFDMSMDRWFYGVLHQFVLDEGSAVAVKNRAARILQNLNYQIVFGLGAADMDIKNQVRTGPSAWTLEDMRVLVLLKTYHYVSNVAFERFFMTNLFPQNAARFSPVMQGIRGELIPLIGK